MDLSQAIRDRRSVKSYADREVDDATLQRIFELVLESPSSFNLQHWRFVLVRDAARRKQLMDAAWGQPHVGAAAVDVIVCGKVNAHEDAERSQAHAPAEVAEKVVGMIRGIYDGKPQLQRDEAIRSASLAAMTLMLVAQAEGLRTCPMIGFDPAKVSEIVGLDESHVPVMLVTLGHPGDGGVFPTSRFPMEEVVRWETLDGDGFKGA
ncbi:MAG: nitroreductase family protein [Planctomycetota bacterium]